MFPALMSSFLLISGQPLVDPKPLQGSWKVTAMIEDGKTLTTDQIATNYVADGMFNIDGNVITMLPPGTFTRKNLIFTLGLEKSQNTIDLAGTAKGGTLGIYTVSGDTMLLCLGKKRPTDFAADAGTEQMLIALKRTTPAATKPVAIAPPPPMADIASKLVGTWGHQDDTTIHYYTLNKDGTFSATEDFKKGFKKWFDVEVRSSGTWKFEGDTVVFTVSKSTDSFRTGQIYSFKISKISDDALTTVNSLGQSRREWRVK